MSILRGGLIDSVPECVECLFDNFFASPLTFSSFDTYIYSPYLGACSFKDTDYKDVME